MADRVKKPSQESEAPMKCFVNQSQAAKALYARSIGRRVEMLLGVIVLSVAVSSVQAETPNDAPTPDSSRGGTAVTTEKITAPIYERFAPEGQGESAAGLGEVPDFQKHVTPLFGRLGCNGRACHGSFQGQGGFQLSLFGYDFEADYGALLEDGAARVDLDDKLESLILTKPVDADMHEGGQRFEKDGWEYWVLRRWIESNAPFEAEEVHQLKRLEVTPKELIFTGADQQQQLRVVAHWEDGTREDVTCLSRFTTNDGAVAKIDEDGRVLSGEAGDTHVVVSYDKAVVPIPVLQPVTTKHGSAYPQIATETTVDELVVEKLRKLGILPSAVCSDEEFLRRASLDVTGTLPAPEEVLEFLADRSPDKRTQKIEALLSRPGYAAQWTTFLCDMTGNNEDQLRNFLPQRVNPLDHWYQWIYQRVEDNVPYDELVEGIVAAQSRHEGESYAEYCEEMSEICRDSSGKKFADRPGLVYYWARNNFRSPEDRAIGFAYSFLGVRIQCAQCHKHPFDQWSKTDFDNFEKLFAPVQARPNTMAADAKREYSKMVADLGVDEKLKGNQLRRKLGDLLEEGQVVPMPELIIAKPRTNGAKNRKNRNAPKVVQAKLLGGEWLSMDGGDVRQDLMQWLRDPENPYFAKAIVNRVWAQYFGVGIVNPADDLNLANAPSNEALLSYLADGFRENGFDLKWLHREILNSDTYQRSWVPNESNQHDKHNFSHSRLRRLSAEATYDAVRMALARDAFSDRARGLEIPRALTEAGASARQNARDDQSYALRVFGRSVRESNCDCDRSSEPSLLQTIFLANDSAVQKWLSDPKNSWVAQVSEKYGWSLGGNASNQMKKKQIKDLLKRFADQVEQAESRLVEAQESGNQKQVDAILKRQSEMVNRAKAAAKRAGVEDQMRAILDGDAEQSADSIAATDKMTHEQAQWIAENAYLRTLSRQPNSEELATVTAFLQSGDKPSVAIESVLWSLVNTKEFILNH